MLRSRPLLSAAAVAGVVWAAALLVLLTGDWALTCTVDGQRLGGIDCFQSNAIPKASSEPARWLGFVPLALAWGGASLALLICVVLGWRSRRADGSVAG